MQHDLHFHARLALAAGCWCRPSMSAQQQLLPVVTAVFMCATNNNRMQLFLH